MTDIAGKRIVFTGAVQVVRGGNARAALVMLNRELDERSALAP